MGEFSFWKDLDNSNNSVNKVIEVLKNNGAKEFHNNNDKRYDVSFNLNGKTYTVEIKEDHKYRATNNIAIEYEDRGKPSGITTSTSDFYAYVLNMGSGYDGIWFIKTKKLRKELFSGEYVRQPIGGDEGTTANFLIPITKFIKLFKRKK